MALPPTDCLLSKRPLAPAGCFDRMNVLIMVSRDPENPRFGGAELVLFKWAELLVTAGFRVDVLCSSFLGAPREVTLNGVQVHRVGPESSLGFTAYLDYHRRFRGRIDVILEESLGGARPPFLASLYAREPVISAWFQDHLPLFEQQFPRALLPALAGMERLVIRVHRNDPTLVPSEASGCSYIQKGGRAGDVVVYHPGLPDDLLGDHEILPANQRERRVLFLGKLRRYKRPDLAIRAFSLAAQSAPGARMVVAGRPDQESYYSELVQLVRSLGLEESISFERGISEERKISLLRTSRVLLSPAPVEGFGIAILEASVYGTPVVGTTGVPVDALQEGVNGFRVPFGDVGAMAEPTRQLLLDDQLFQRLSPAAAEFARKFSWPNSIQPLLGILKNIDGGALRAREVGMA
jgi:glycosyltransferase involved in cell wall biosynthesis